MLSFIKISLLWGSFLMIKSPRVKCSFVVNFWKIIFFQIMCNCLWEYVILWSLSLVLTLINTRNQIFTLFDLNTLSIFSFNSLFSAELCWHHLVSSRSSFQTQSLWCYNWNGLPDHTAPSFVTACDYVTTWASGAEFIPSHYTVFIRDRNLELSLSP